MIERFSNKKEPDLYIKYIRYKTDTNLYVITLFNDKLLRKTISRAFYEKLFYGAICVSRADNQIDQWCLAGMGVNIIRTMVSRLKIAGYYPARKLCKVIHPPSHYIPIGLD